jgi:heterodisulfide reductase subunit C2
MKLKNTLRETKLPSEKDNLTVEAKTSQLPEGMKSRRAFIKEVMKMPGGERILECIQCGSCAGGCPVIFAMDYSPMQMIKMINLGMREEVMSSSTIWLCSSCYTCTTRCPREVSFATLAMSLKNKAIRDNFVKDDSKVKFHKSFFEVVDKYGRNYEPELFLNILNIKDPKGLLRNAFLGIRLLKKQKMKLTAPKTEQHPWQKIIVEKMEEMERK